MRIDVSGYNPSVKTIIEATSHHLAPYVKEMRRVHATDTYDVPETAINLPFDESIVNEVEILHQKLASPSLRYIFLIGIGGSNLGCEAIYQALFSFRDCGPHSHPRLIVFDTNSETSITALQGLFETISHPEEFVVIVVSKSGATTETVANAEIILEILEKQCNQPIPKRTVVISDKDTLLSQLAIERGIHTLPIPKVVGGRFSVFSAVGLLPLRLCNVSINELLTGARAAVVQGSHSDVALNELSQLTLVLVDAYKSGHHIHDFFVFNKEFETLGKWWRQLVGESCGKKAIHSDKIIGITPTVSVGSTDLHSVGQLYLGGCNNKCTIFVSAPDSRDLSVPQLRVFPEIIPNLTGKTTSQIMSAILEGTKSAFIEKKRPFIHIQLPDISPHSIGFLMQSLIMSTILTAKLLDVNAFDQPDVELYKSRTRELLGT
jgi:glucose-6-phosphate isomerase